MRVNYRVLSIYLLGVFIGALDTNVLGPAFRVIAANFHVTLGVTAWTITAYSVAYVAATALFGALGDRLGHRRIFGLGVALFGLASMVAAFAPNLTVFLLARSLQGAGAGAVYPNAQAEGLGQFPANKRGMALGMFGASLPVRDAPPDRRDGGRQSSKGHQGHDGQGHVDEKNGWPTHKLSKRATQIGSNDTSKTKHGAKHP